jgi:hypothetical protein
LGLPVTASEFKINSMTPLLSNSSQVSKRIRRNNSVKYYGEIQSTSR